MINMGIDERLIFGPRAGDGVATVGFSLDLIQRLLRFNLAFRFASPSSRHPHTLAPPAYLTSPADPRSTRPPFQVTEDGQVFFDEDRAGKKGVELEALMHSAVRLRSGHLAVFPSPLFPRRASPTEYLPPPQTLDKRNIAFRPLPILEAIRLINAAGMPSVVVACSEQSGLSGGRSD